MVMEEYISKTRLAKKVHTGMNIHQVMQAIIEAPVADVVERKKGKWICINSMIPIFKCDQCNSVTLGGNFCPNCGADMREASQ